MVKSPTPHLAYILETLETIKANTPKDKAVFLG